MSNIQVDYSLYKDAVYDNLVTGIVFGAYIVIYITSGCVLLIKPGFTSSPPRKFMFGITTFIFVLGIVALVLVVIFQFQSTLLDIEFAEDSIDLSLFFSLRSITTSWATVTRLMYILSDIICAWRTVVLWNRDKRVIAVLLIFVLGATAAAVCDIYFTVAFFFGEPKLSIENPAEIGQRALIRAVPTLATNLLSTGLIAWKAWQRRIPVKEHLREGSRFVRIDRVFALLIESGFIYCCIWIFYLISAFELVLDPGFIVMALVSGLYSTLIIILVGMQMSPVEYYSTHSTTGMQFAPGPAIGLPRDGNMPRPMLTIHREYVTDVDTQIPTTVFMQSFDEEKRFL